MEKEILTNILSKLDKLDRGQQELKADVGEMKQDIRNLYQGQDHIRKDVINLYHEIGTLRNGQEELRSEMRAGFKSLEGAIRSLKTSVDYHTHTLLIDYKETKERVDKLEKFREDLGNIFNKN
ncbi:hypothetical protein L1765_03095 [Microaerobacter geothermalis]|uniref:hypothetical protein n=1 Tax=Microaerobacter geothermalis TaxID=674972 RepID=UPI001F1C3D8A|nr:hypothetical protein [Microaerobacter geothermalis]MCF6092980.1 hypothetical protein [Microaerobacter geothermalis]